MNRIEADKLCSFGKSLGNSLTFLSRVHLLRSLLTPHDVLKLYVSKSLLSNCGSEPAEALLRWGQEVCVFDLN